MITKKSKKGQLTLFVILTLILVIGIIFYFVAFNNTVDETLTPEVELLRDNVLDCLESSYATSLNIIGAQGGYFETPEPYTSTNDFIEINVPFYYNQGDVLYPAIQDIEDGITQTARLDANFCFEVIKSDNSFNSVSFDTTEVEVIINDDDITFISAATMTVDSGNTTQSVDLSQTPVIVTSEIVGMHTVATFVADYFVTNGEWIPFTDIATLSEVHNLYVTVYDSDNGYGNTIEIVSLNSDSHPNAYIFTNAFSHTNLEEVGLLL